MRISKKFLYLISTVLFFGTIIILPLVVKSYVAFLEQRAYQLANDERTIKDFLETLAGEEVRVSNVSRYRDYEGNFGINGEFERPQSRGGGWFEFWELALDIGFDNNSLENVSLEGATLESMDSSWRKHCRMESNNYGEEYIICSWSEPSGMRELPVLIAKIAQATQLRYAYDDRERSFSLSPLGKSLVFLESSPEEEKQEKPLSVANLIPFILATLILLYATVFYVLKLMQKSIASRVLVVTSLLSVVLPVLVSYLIFSIFPEGLIFLLAAPFIIIAGLIMGFIIFGLEVLFWKLKGNPVAREEKKTFAAIAFVYAVYVAALPFLAYLAWGSPYLD